MAVHNIHSIKKASAETIHIVHQEQSWAKFTFSEIGDLHVNSDWGFYSFSWAAFECDPKEPFKKFLATVNAEYIVGKLASNYLNQTMKRLGNRKEEALTVLVQCFIDELKTEIS